MGEIVASDEADDPVARQYEKWVYPAPCADLTVASLNSQESNFKDLRGLYWAYWPNLPYRDDLDILIAGCGSMAAAGYACLYPRCRVVGIDISGASLAHEEFLKEKHGLKNLSLHRCRVEDAASLGATFDFIGCHGVLHHLADPVVGLRALGGVLRRDGVIAIMVYAKYGRAGVYMLQELFRLMGLEQSAGDVQIVKDVLAGVNASHPAQRYRRLATDLDTDNGLVDTFLHKRDRPFTVTDCLGLVRSAGLVFQGWDENGLYHPDAHLPVSTPLRAHLDRLSGPELWQAVELLDGNIPGHWFYACRAERDPASYTIQFDDDAFLDYIPVARVSQVTAADAARQKPASISRPPLPPAQLDGRKAALFSQVDSKRSVRQCLESAGIGGQSRAAVEFARNFFRSLWRVGYVLFRLPA